MEVLNNNKTWKREDFAPLSFWAWNDKMDDESIIQRIHEFHEQGFRGFFMHSRGGLLTPYLSEDWFHACRTAADEAAKYGMEAWIYDEDGWPSGFAGGRVNALGEEYLSKFFVFVTEKPENIQHVIASYRKEEEGYVVCEFDDADVWVVYHLEPNYADLLSKKVTKSFIEITYERYKKEMGDRLGSVIPGFFTDEPQYFRIGFPYSYELGEFFKKRNGYNMEENLYQLMAECAVKESFRFRQDFWNTIQEMMCENFSKQIYDWCEENHVIFTGHYPGEDSLIQQVESTAGVMPKYRYEQMPGIDHLGRRITSLLLTKQVTSVAKQTGKKKIISETFGCAGWDISFEDMCYIWGWQASAGINVPLLHIGAHSIIGIRKRDYPAFYSYQEPWWNEFQHISTWLGGIGYKMALGKWIEDTLVISPMQSIYCWHGETDNYTNEEKEIAASYRRLCDNLMDNQVGFDLGDEVVMAELGSIEGNTIKVGSCEYRQVIVSEATVLQDSTWNLLELFYRNGGRVIFTERIPAGSKEKDWVKTCAVVSNSRRTWNKYFQFIHYERPVTVYEKSGFSVAEKLNISVKKDQDMLRAYLWNFATDSEREVLVSISGQKIIYCVDPESLEREKLQGNFYAGNRETILPLTIKGKQSILLEIEDGKQEEISIPTTKMIEFMNTKPVRTEDNVLTIDYASFSVDGEHYSEPLPIVKLHPQLYKELEKSKVGTINTKYYFHSQMSKQCDLQVAIEDRDCIDIQCNGTSILGNQEGWYIDRGIHKYRIPSDLIAKVNTIEVIYQVQTTDVKDAEGLFETEVNRFFYPVEPEAIYILGDFNVEANCEVCNNRTHIRLAKPTFQISDAKELVDIKDVTVQGLWFYRGNLKTDLTINYTQGERKYVQIRNPKGAFCEIRCNQNSKIVYMEPYITEITDYLKEGENIISVILHGTNRNIFGPHHHVKGENKFVGCNTFKGKKGYEDAMFNFELEGEETWTDEYSFVVFGCDEIMVITEKK